MKHFQAGNPAIVKTSLVATSMKALTRKMFLNNIKENSQLEYDIMKDGNNWVAWFYKEIKIQEIKNESN